MAERVVVCPTPSTPFALKMVVCPHSLTPCDGGVSPLPPDALRWWCVPTPSASPCYSDALPAPDALRWWCVPTPSPLPLPDALTAMVVCPLSLLSPLPLPDALTAMVVCPSPCCVPTPSTLLCPHSLPLTAMVVCPYSLLTPLPDATP